MNQEVIFGQGSIDSLESVASNFNITTPFLITGKHSYNFCGAKDKIEALFNITQRDSQHTVESNIPEVQEVERGLSHFRTGNFDAIIAIGGGLVLDTGKLIRFLAIQKINAIDIFDHPNQEVAKGNIPLVAIPTTAGSGAEATHFSVLYKDKMKYSIANGGILPDVALVDPNLTLSTPSKVAAASGLDVLCQGIESYWSVYATDKSKSYAKDAIQSAVNNLVPAIRSDDINSKINLSQAALRAGQAINISKTTAPHAISYPLTTSYGISHGHAVALTLGEFIKLAGNITGEDCNHPSGVQYIKRTINELCDLLQAPDVHFACTKIKDLVREIGLETQLSTLGARESDIDQIVNQVNLERLSNHPQKLSNKLLRTVLNNCF